LSRRSQPQRNPGDTTTKKQEIRARQGCPVRKKTKQKEGGFTYVKQKKERGEKKNLKTEKHKGDALGTRENTGPHIFRET